MKRSPLIVSLGVGAVLAGLHVALTPVAFAQGGPLPAPIQNHTTVENHVTVQIPDMDPVVVREASGEAAGGVLNTVIAPPPVEWANDLLSLPNVWTQTPDNLTWNNDAIRKLAQGIQAVGMALIVLAVFARGISIVVGREDLTGMGRIVFAAIACAGNLMWWQVGIQMNNAINTAISSPSLPSLVKPHLTTTIDPAAAVGTVAVLVVYAVTALLLMFSQLFRLGLVDILISIGGLALICYASPQTEYIANHYTRISVAICFSQVVVSVCLMCASVLTALGSSGMLGTLLGIAVLWLARSAPQAILAGSGNGSNQGSRMGGLVFSAIRRRIGAR